MRLFNKKIRAPALRPVTGSNLQKVLTAVMDEVGDDVLQGMVLLSNVTCMALYAWTGGNKTSAKAIMDDMINQIWDQIPEVAPDLNRSTLYDVAAHNKKARS